MKHSISGLLLALLPLAAMSQQISNDSLINADSLPIKPLQEVVVIAKNALSNNKAKVLSSLDNYLEHTNQVNMVKRGAYAWEPLLNGMATERSIITIDGMRIYGACTDKMDPVTSYVEITNLSKANIHSGQAGGANGATIAGSIDLVRNKTDFGSSGLKGNIFTGYETNNRQKIVGGNMQYANQKIFTDIDFTYRNATNYKDGNNNEILYSQFTKYNVSATVGKKINAHSHIEASVIYDRAIDVGYAALPMDVSLAEAFIGSVAYIQHHVTPWINNWETKLYYNNVTHIMDDTKRPIVPIRMDMPGWSKTTGMYSFISGQLTKHDWKATLSAHHNQSLAEMTMYSNNPEEKDMFMLTWPGVNTNYAGLFLEDNFKLTQNFSVNGTAGLSMHHNHVNDEFGLASLRIFYPQMKAGNLRLLKNLSFALVYQPVNWKFSVGGAYGERAPSVSEGYGFYLFNSFDRFDYVGKPDMRNEKSWEANTAIQYNKQKLDVKLQGALFHIKDYIIGRPNNNFIPMTIGANGIKVYEQLQHANLLNLSTEAAYSFLPRWNISAKTVYRKGITNDKLNLPLIQPFSYGSTLRYKYKSFFADAVVEGAVKQKKFSPEFGETAAAAYTIFNTSASYRFKCFSKNLTIKTGIENMFNKYYSTFADWNRIPRMGRNVFVNVIVSL